MEVPCCWHVNHKNCRMQVQYRCLKVNILLTSNDTTCDQLCIKNLPLPSDKWQTCSVTGFAWKWNDYYRFFARHDKYNILAIIISGCITEIRQNGYSSVSLLSFISILQMFQESLLKLNSPITCSVIFPSVQVVLPIHWCISFQDILFVCSLSAFTTKT